TSGKPENMANTHSEKIPSYDQIMRLFENYWFRWFAGAFIIGATLPVAASATDRFKDLKVMTGRFSFSGASAWVAAALLCGIGLGILGLSGAALKSISRKASHSDA
ncbi:MAG: hypothetical protein KY445_10760, partial [Armatimonadetes bacterium]|nr:hypothetical protein [Armatimonadota bacterium]